MMILPAYLAHLVLSGARPTTIQVRDRVLAAFARTVDGDLLAATRLDVCAYLARPLTPESRRAYRSHLRGFYAWALEEGLLDVDPTERVPAVRVPRGQPRPVEPEDLAHALARADARMRAWLLLMTLAGLRCLEVANLWPADLVLSPVPLLYLRETKGGGTATVPAHPAVLAALQALPVSGGRWWRVQPATVSKMVAGYLRGVGVDATAHQLRHTAGTSWYEHSGHDLLTTARLLRHANVATTQVYARLDAARPYEVASAVPVPGLTISKMPCSRRRATASR